MSTSPTTTPVSRCCGAATESSRDRTDELAQLADICTACGKACEAAEAVPQPPSAPVQAEQPVTPEPKPPAADATAGGDENPCSVAVKVSRYLLTGMHHSTPEGRVAINAIVQGYTARAVSEATKELRDAEVRAGQWAAMAGEARAATMRANAIIGQQADEAKTLTDRAEKAEAERDTYWKQICDTVEALGKISPEAAPYSVSWAKQLKADLVAMTRELFRANLLRNDLAIQGAVLAAHTALVEKLTSALAFVLSNETHRSGSEYIKARSVLAEALALTAVPPAAKINTQGGEKL